MSCYSDTDCIKNGFKCNKDGSNIFCSDDKGCACTFPTNNTIYVVLVIILIIIWYSLQPPSFIASAFFSGAKYGYVFKTKDGLTGYYLDKNSRT